MGILDFREISPATKSNKSDYGGNLDDFEKFAQEFFCELYSVKLIECATRGADGGRDLLFNIKIEGSIQKWVVSCKHTAFSGNTVGVDDEKNISDRFVQVAADVFICFYSQTASSALEKKLVEMKSNMEKFDFIIFNSAKIETNLLSANNGKGWFLAARYFPTSFLRLFERFIHPIEHYTSNDVITESSTAVHLPGAGGAKVCFAHPGERDEAITDLVRSANEHITFALHETFFAKVLTEITHRWPECFAYWGTCPVDQIDISKIYPTFNPESILNILHSDYRNEALIVCFFWTWWNEQRAHSIYHEVYATRYDSLITESQTRSFFSVNYVIHSCNFDLRNIITRLVAFGHNRLEELHEWDKVALTAKHLHQEEELNIVLKELHQKSVDNFSFDKRVNLHSPEQRQLFEYSAVLGQDIVRQKIRSLINQWDRFNYQTFDTLKKQNISWTIHPSDSYNWNESRVLKT